MSHSEDADSFALSNELHDAGFVHVTGLVAAWPTTDPASRHAYQIEGSPGLVKHAAGRNNGTAVVYTIDGEVWLGSYEALAALYVNGTLEEATAEASAFVPCSNGERISQIELLERLADQYSEPRVKLTVEAESDSG